MAGRHHHHGPTIAADADRRRLGLALALILAFVAVEVVAGVVAGSLALLSDAAHMLTDVAAIALALAAISLAARPPRGSMTYGLKRVEPLSALVNGVALAVLALVFVVEAVGRLRSPPEVDGALVLVVALAGIPVNLVAVRLLAGSRRRSVNVEGAFAHVVTDLYAFVLTAIAGGVVLATGFDRADPIAALVIAALMLHATWRLLRVAGRIFLEAAPEGVDPDEIGRALAAVPGVTEVHDLHVWELTSDCPALSAHAVVAPDADCHAARAALEELIGQRFGVTHSTLQVEHAPRRLLAIE